MSKDGGKGGEKGKGKGGAIPVDDEHLAPSERKLLKAYLRKVERCLWSVDEANKAKALSDLRGHLLSKTKEFRMDNAMELAILSTGSPEAIADGIRALYGYGTFFKAFLVSLSALIAVATVPMFSIWALISMMVLFLFISNMGIKTGVRMGGLMGLAAGMSRTILAFGLALLFPDDLTIGTDQAIIDFLLVSAFTVLVGLLAGHIRESSMRRLLRSQHL